VVRNSNADYQYVKQGSSTLDNVLVAQGNRVESAGINCNAGHRLMIPGALSCGAVGVVLCDGGVGYWSRVRVGEVQLGGRGKFLSRPRISRSCSFVCFTGPFCCPLVPRGHAASFGSIGLFCPSVSRSHSTARHAHAKRTCGPLLFVIGTPNVAALHWRGRWQRSGKGNGGQPCLL
jgi:hypothetical protein